MSANDVLKKVKNTKEKNCILIKRSFDYAEKKNYFTRQSNWKAINNFL